MSKPAKSLVEVGYISPIPDLFGEEIISLSTTVHSGNMSFNNGDQTMARDNRKNLFHKLGLDIEHLIIIQPNQVDQIVWVNKKFLTRENPVQIKADTLLSTESNLILGLATADCIPVFFYESTKKIIGLAHAGRRGIELHILTKTLKKIIDKGGDLARVKIYLGPGIQRCCYCFSAKHFEDEFKTNEWYNFSSKFRGKQGKITSFNLDLYGRALSQLTNFEGERGEKLSIHNIARSHYCTFCSGLFFSHRRSQKENKPEQRFLSLIVRK